MVSWVKVLPHGHYHHQSPISHLVGWFSRLTGGQASEMRKPRRVCGVNKEGISVSFQPKRGETETTLQSASPLQTLPLPPHADAVLFLILCSCWDSLEDLVVNLPYCKFPVLSAQYGQSKWLTMMVISSVSLSSAPAMLLKSAETLKAAYCSCPNVGIY